MTPGVGVIVGVLVGTTTFWTVAWVVDRRDRKRRASRGRGR